MARYHGRHAAARQASAMRRRRFLGGSRLSRGLGATAVAAVAMAALTASQAPGVELGGGKSKNGGGNGLADGGRDGSPGDSSYHTELPPLESPNPPGTAPGSPGAGGDESGIPASVLAAYKKAAKSLASSSACGLRWELLAGIGKVESGQARGGAVDKDGTTLKPILGPVLNGQGFANISDTDGGQYDGDSTYDRAVGPMQFIPSTWDRWGADGSGDGKKDPNNIYDAALAAGRYLCADGRDLGVKADLDRAILSYNHSSDYLRTVLAWFEYYREGAHGVPDGEGVLPTSPGAGGSSDTPAKGSPERAGGSSGKKPGKPGIKPDKPNRPGSPGNGGGSSPGPTPPDKPTPPGTPSPNPTPTAPASLERVGAQEFTAVAGDDFTGHPQVKAETSKGKGVKGVRVQFEIRGETGALFAGGAKRATVSTNAEGVATAPKLSSGTKVGDFTVRATAPGRGLKAVDFGASVTAARADTLARTSDSALESAKGGDFANDVEVKATRKGKAVAGAAVSAALADTAKGPYFKGADDKPLRALNGLKTNSKGVLKLPKLYADGNSGSYTLTLKATGGAKLTIKLTVKD